MHGNNIVLDKIKTIAAINVLEPVTMTNLSRALKNIIEPDLLSNILGELLIEGLISSEKRNYRVTRIGMSFNPSRESKTLRDIYRMKHLLAIGKQRGVIRSGDDSSSIM